jgi:diguanylate cyclase (GGDEF)-like protein
MFGLTSDEATSQILANWGLPDLLVSAIRYRNAPEGRDNQTPLGAILEVSDDAARLMLADDDTVRATALDALTSSAATHLGMTIGDVELIIGELEPELEEMAKTFDLGSMSQAPVDEIVKAAQTQLTTLSLNLATQLNHEQVRNENLTELNRKLEEEASTDSLTSLPNRRTFDAYLGNQVAGRLRNPRSTMLALVIFDLDHFKAVNDNFGHSVGDEVLQEIGKRLLDGSRRGELAARVGGEEFAVIMPDVVVQELAGAAERMRAMIGGAPVDTAIGPLAVTASIGAAYTAVAVPDIEAALYKKADDALYASKEGGRDRVTVVALDA